MKNPHLRKFIFALVGIGSSYLFAEPPKLSCLNLGGGYLTQSIDIKQNSDESFEFNLAYFTPVPEVVQREFGLKVDGELAKRLSVTFPKDHCKFKQTDFPHIHLGFCSTGVSKISAKIELLNGTQKVIQLADNNSVEIFRETRESVTQTQKSTRVELKLGQAQEPNALGFLVRDCH